MARAATVRAALLAAFDRSAPLEVDLSRVAEIDTTGVQILIAAKREAASRGLELRFVEHSPAVLEVMDLLDLAASFGDPVLLHAGTERTSR